MTYLSQSTPPAIKSIQNTAIEPTASPMDIDIQSAQFSTKKSLPDRVSHGKPYCFYLNGLAMLLQEVCNL